MTDFAITEDFPRSEIEYVLGRIASKRVCPLQYFSSRSEMTGFGWNRLRLIEKIGRGWRNQYKRTGFRLGDENFCCRGR